MTYVFGLTIIFIANLNLITSENYTSPNISLSNLNITKILTSKIQVNLTEEDATFSFYNESDIYDEDSIDFTTMYPDEAKQLYKIAEKKGLMVETDFKKEALRSSRYKEPEEVFWWNPVLMTTAIDLMTHAVYATRYRLRETKPLRSKMYKFLEYEAALKYGALMQLRLKMHSVYTTMKKYLVLYERCLAMSTDIDQMVKELFEVQQKFDLLKDTNND